MNHAETDQWQEAAQHLLAVNRPEQAERLVRQHLAQHPRHAFAHVVLALTLFRQQRLLEADEAANSAIRLNPQESEAFYMLSLVQANADKAALAETNIREALRLSPINSKYLGTLAWILNATTRPTEAKAAAEMGLRYDPAHVECLTQLAQAQELLQQWDPLLSTLHYLVSLRPQSSVAHQWLGQEALRREEYTQAQAHYQEALRLDPTNSKVHQGLSQTLRYQSKIGRLAHGLNRYLTFVSEGTKNRVLRAWGHFFLILIPLSLLCIPLLLFLGFESLYWRLHPEVRQLRNRPAGAPSYLRETFYRYGAVVSFVFLLVAFLPPVIWIMLKLGFPDSALGPGLTGGLTILVMSIGQALKSAAEMPLPDKSPAGWLLLATLVLVASLGSSLWSALWPWGPPAVLVSNGLLFYCLVRGVPFTQAGRTLR
ncbi:tetratricopeptide repeat protein [Hymenobacter wooponensis]|uniref:Tetratricopeptide repeat protein n=1 Tax=Hymenobacter wooponensis TaxID=1525360 RepID=A0A4Z0MUX8_9BACT|nr:tetratricopeptide repeat protein [Hymenobacter wooponensis]TGD83116.1 tetratricopeptide repeat protein [Hymenobacter wooponensis]